MRVAVGIPTLNNVAGATRLIRQLRAQIDDIFVVANCPRTYERLRNCNAAWLCGMKENLGVAGSWNLLAEQAFNRNYTHILMLNDDLLISDSLLSTLSFYCSVGSVVAHFLHRFACFLLPRNVYARIGRFDDEFWPAYQEDVDYVYRMRLARLPLVYFHCPIHHEGRKTEQIDLYLGNTLKVREHARDNYARYLRKWGGPPGQEQYQVPFNGV